ncbi:DUF6578 domain-containing protein [Streptomyces sp. NPDC001852]|uniref:DUF6578 domain-containing protein n=1 Tax=Streptomyces sp. NPDC001852 TaxID=3364619 RepID=UPI0036BFE9C5
MRVFYENWQMECCGTPFAVGDEVAWPLVAHDAEDIRQGRGYGAGARVENHGGPDSMEPVPGAHTLEAVGACPKWFESQEPGREPGPHRIRRAVGVLVALEVPDGTPPEPGDHR